MDHSSQKFDDNWYKNQKVKFTLRLYKSANINRDSVGELIDIFDEFISECTLKNLEYKTNELKKRKRDMFECFKAILYESKNPFKQLNTEHLRMKVYEDECSYLEPQKFTAYLKDDFKKDTQKRVEAVWLPLSHQLRVLLERPGVYNEMLKYEDKINKLFYEKKIICNVIHGKLWQNFYLPLFKDKIVKPILLSFDDYETSKALGSHHGSQKFGAVYISLPTLPPHLRAKLKNIFLTTLFHSEDRELSHGDVFKKIIDELNILSEEGLCIKVYGKTVKVYFQCVSIIADNLGHNQIGGFEGGFNATYYCRRCRTTSDMCKYLTKEILDSLRTEENYAEDLLNLKYGVKCQSIFNELKNFHIVRNPSLDLMHDVFEGIARSVVEGVLTFLIIVQGKITLADVNKAIVNFNYGTLESKNKPRPIEIESCSQDIATGLTRKIKCTQSAAEMACLSRFLGLMIGDQIDREDPYWSLYLDMRRFIGLVTAPTFITSDVYEIENIVEELLTKFVSLLKEVSPKGHNLTHIKEIMMQLGPLIHLWTMPSERKHREGTNVANNTNSHTNLPYTIGVQNQLHMSYMRVKCENVESKVKLGTLIDDNCDLEFEKILHDVEEGSDMMGPLNCQAYSFIKINGKKYAPGTVVVIDINETPEFGRIAKIYKAKGQVYLYVKRLEVLNDFDQFYHAYEVEELSFQNSAKVLISINKLPEVEPCIDHKNEDGLFIATRYDL